MKRCYPSCFTYKTEAFFDSYSPSSSFKVESIDLCDPGFTGSTFSSVQEHRDFQERLPHEVPVEWPQHVELPLMGHWGR